MAKMLPTQYREQQALALAAKRSVIHLLEWDEQSYFDFQYKTGCAYLQEYIPRDPEGIDMLIASRFFWNWWRNRWAERDQKFIAKRFADADVETRLALYKIMNSPEDLADAIYPNSVVLKNSYPQMISEYLDNKEDTK